MPCWCHNSPAPEKHFKNKEKRSAKGVTMDKNMSSSPYLRSWHLLGSLSSYKVNFRILLRYKGNQHTANTKTRQKTVLATSRLWKRNKIADFKVCITVKCETNTRRIGNKVVRGFCRCQPAWCDCKSHCSSAFSWSSACRKWRSKSAACRSRSQRATSPLLIYRTVD